jgi:hypothetical protein
MKELYKLMLNLLKNFTLNNKKDNTSEVLKFIGAIMIVLAWLFGWIPGLGLFLFIGGIALMTISFFFN